MIELAAPYARLSVASCCIATIDPAMARFIRK
jgi:hypothetical protein